MINRHRRLSIALALVSSLMAAPAQAAGIKPVWSAKPSTEVVVNAHPFRSGDAQLSGTLYIPQADRPVPAIVVTHGASSPLRTSPLYQHLIQMMPALGVAVLVYDRRTSGASTGAKGDFEMLASDALAGVRSLQGDRRIDRAKIGIWGLSQGGWLSLLAASKEEGLAFAVSISAPLVTPDVQMLFSSTNTLRVNGYSDAAIAQMRATRLAVDDYMRGKGDRATAQRLVDEAKRQPWFKYLYMGETVRDRAVSGWRREIEHDPLATLRSVRVPSLIIYGAADPVVPVATSVARLDPLMKSRPQFELAVIAEADHSMQLGVDPRDQLDPARADAGYPNAPAYFAVLTRWLTAQGLIRQ